MKKRKAIRLISFSLALAFAAIGFALKSEMKAQSYRLELENGYSSNLEDLNTAINNIALTLNKARFVTDLEQMSSMAAKLLCEAELSKTALAQLPVNSELKTLNRFLSQVGNFAMSVSKGLISGNAVSEKQNENIELLNSTAAKISQIVSNTQITYNNSGYWASELDRKIEAETEKAGFSAALSELEESLTDLPSLIYDGPYSDHILEKEPEMLKNARSVTEREAVKAAAEICECDEADLNLDGEINGHIPAFRFAGEGLSVAISKTGGYGVYMRRERSCGEILLSYTQALEKARRYLDRIGMSGLKETYYFSNEGVCVVNFAFLDGQTLCYTDLVKVGVAMDNGEIMLYEAAGYIANHKDRAFPSPTYTALEAEEKLSDKLELYGTSVALIPTSGGGEVRCYELACTSKDGQEILVYINVATLKEEQILILLKSDGGTLVK